MPAAAGRGSFYITTPIYYVNDTPHIGTAYTTIACDVVARYKRLTGFDTFYLTGTDEHSMNVERKALSQGLTPQAYCDQVSQLFKETWQQLNISFDDFIRTTEPRHHHAAQLMVRRARDKGDIYKGKYRGWYCSSCERFYLEADLVNGRCEYHPNQDPVWLEEDNYFFRLSLYQQRLLDHIEAHPDFIEPEERRNEVVSVIRSGLEDFSISRSTFKWGIPFPDDPDQVIYVWFDALVNYLTGVGFGYDEAMFKRYWPADVHVLGKDIIRFHCIYWPAMLMAADLELPRKLFAHGFIYFKGEKMSKSLGNVIRPLELAERFGLDGLRYILMRQTPFGRDGDFTWESVTERYNADLANDLGNLLNRTLVMVQRYRDGLFPAATGAHAAGARLRETASAILPEIDQAMDHLQLSDALASIWKLVTAANRYIEEAAPWVLARSRDEAPALDDVLYNLGESIRLIAHLVQPYMPASAEAMAGQLGVALDTSGDWSRVSPWGQLPAGTRIGTPAPLFPRKE